MPVKVKIKVNAFITTMCTDNGWNYIHFNVIHERSVELVFKMLRKNMW